MAGQEGLKSVPEIKRSVEMIDGVVQARVRQMLDRKLPVAERRGARDRLTEMFFQELRDFVGGEVRRGTLGGQPTELAAVRIVGEDIQNCEELLELYQSGEKELSEVQRQRMGIVWSGIYGGVRDGVVETVEKEEAAEILAMTPGKERDERVMMLYGGGRVLKGMEVAVEAGLRQIVGEDVAEEVETLEPEAVKEAVVEETGGGAESESGEVGLAAVVAELRALRQDLSGGVTRGGGGADRALDQTGGEEDEASRRVAGDLRSQILGDDLMKRYYEESLKRQQKMEEVTEEKWLEGLMSKSANQSPPPGLWQVEVPKWMEGVAVDTKDEHGGVTDKETNWRWIFELADALSVAVATRRKDPKFGSDVEYIGEAIIGMAPIPEKFLNYLYNYKGLGVREALERVVGDLLEPRELERVDGLYRDGPNNKVKYWVFKENGNDYADSVLAFQKDSSEYKEKMAAKLVADGVCRTIEQAQMAVSIACDVLELGGVWECADSKRKIGYASDALRVVMRPETKFRAKVGAGGKAGARPEIFGGPWAEYLLAVTNSDPARALQLGMEMGIIPQLLCGSILNREVEVAGKKQVAFGEALMKQQKIEFEKREDDFYFGWKKDGVKAACSVWRYITFGKQLQFKTIAEVDNVISEWRRSLYNDVKALRENGYSVLPTALVAAAVGGSAGLFPFEGPYLRVVPVDSNIMRDYQFVVSQILEGVGLSSKETNELKKFFSVSFVGAYQLNFKANIWKARKQPLL